MELSNYPSDDSGKSWSSRLAKSESSLSRMESYQKPKSRVYVQTLTDHKYFVAFMHVVVFLNVVELGISADARDMHSKLACVIAEHVFTVIFAIEMIIKLTTLGRKYFAERLNILDFVIAWMSIVDMWCIGLLFQDAVPASLGLFRTLRVLRIAKLFSVHKQLYILAIGIMQSLSSMFWVGVLLFVIIYACAIACVQVFGQDDYGDSYQPHFSNTKQFGDVPRSMLSLFNIVLLDEWGTTVRPIYENLPWAVPFLIVFVVFTACGILNVMIGVIVDKVAEARAKEHEEDLLQHRQKQMEAMEGLTKIIIELDVDQNRRISRSELGQGKANSTFMDLLRMLDLPKGFTLGDLFCILNRTAEEEVDEKEFLEGMFRLIFSNDFQQMCMLHLSLNEMKRGLLDLRQETRNISEAFASFGDKISATLEQNNATSLSRESSNAPNIDCRHYHGHWEAIPQMGERKSAHFCASNGIGGTHANTEVIQEVRGEIHHANMIGVENIGPSQLRQSNLREACPQGLAESSNAPGDCALSCAQNSHVARSAIQELACDAPLNFPLSGTLTGLHNRPPPRSATPNPTPSKTQLHQRNLSACVTRTGSNGEAVTAGQRTCLHGASEE